jgi:hypothetical protein
MRTQNHVANGNACVTGDTTPPKDFMPIEKQAAFSWALGLLMKKLAKMLTNQTFAYV